MICTIFNSLYFPCLRLSLSTQRVTRTFKEVLKRACRRTIINKCVNLVLSSFTSIVSLGRAKFCKSSMIIFLCLISFLWNFPALNYRYGSSYNQKSGNNVSSSSLDRVRFVHFALMFLEKQESLYV